MTSSPCEYAIIQMTNLCRFQRVECSVRGGNITVHHLEICRGKLKAKPPLTNYKAEHGENSVSISILIPGVLDQSQSAVTRETLVCFWTLNTEAYTGNICHSE